MDTGLLIARMVFGLLLAAHGTQKLFGWFGGYGLAGTGAYFEQLGFRPGRFFAATAASTEIAAGLLVALGLLGPLGPALIISVMLVAMATVHWQHGLFAQNNGIEVPLLYAVTAVTLAPRLRCLFRGAGLAGLVHRRGVDRHRPRCAGRRRQPRDPEDRHRTGARLNCQTCALYY